MEEYLRILKTPTDDGKIYLPEDMVPDIESIADSWFKLSFLDKIPFPVERGILMYSWLIKINPNNMEYKENLDKLNKRLIEVH